MKELTRISSRLSVLAQTEYLSVRLNKFYSLQLADYKPQTNLQITSLPARDSPSCSKLGSDLPNKSQLRLENVEDGGGKAGAPHSSGQIQ